MRQFLSTFLGVALGYVIGYFLVQVIHGLLK